MNMTKQWVEKQIKDYKRMISILDDSKTDKQLRTIWGVTLNTLATTLQVINKELAA